MNYKEIPLITSPSPFKTINFMSMICSKVPYDKLCEYSSKINRIATLKTLQKLLNYNTDIAILIEASIFEFTIEYNKCNSLDDNIYLDIIYMDKANNIIDNLSETSSVNNTYLKQALLTNSVNPQMVAFMKPYEIFPDKWKKEINRKQLIEFKKNNMATTDIYKCHKCGERKTKIVQLQLRSADEPMTNIITCQVCYNVWKK